MSRGGSDRRPAQAFLHGTTGPVVLLTGRVANFLLDRTELARLRASCRGDDPEIDSGLLALTMCAHAWRTSAGGSNGGSALAAMPEAAPPSEWVSTTRAADLLCMTDRAVRLACQTGRLPAELVDGRWRITRDDLEQFRTSRSAA